MQVEISQEGPAASAPQGLRPRLLGPSATPGPPGRKQPRSSHGPTVPPCGASASCLPPARGARPALLLSRPRPLHQYACRAAPCRPGFGVGPGPAHPPAPGGCHGTAWAPRAHRATRRRKRRQAGAVAPHTRTMLPPPPLQLQPVLLSGPVRSSACQSQQSPDEHLPCHSLMLVLVFGFVVGFFLKHMMQVMVNLQVNHRSIGKTSHTREGRAFLPGNGACFNMLHSTKKLSPFCAVATGTTATHAGVGGTCTSQTLTNF